MSRSMVVGALLMSTVVGLASACGGDTRVPAVDTSPGSVGVVDSAPASAATVVAAMLTDENVFALLDTAYAAIIDEDRLAQGKTNGPVNDFATKSVSENSVTRSGVKSTAERLNI